MSRASQNTSTFSGASLTPVIIATGMDEAQNITFPTLTARSTPTPLLGITATPFPIRKSAEDPSGNIYFISDNASKVSFIPINAQGVKSTDTQSWPIEGLSNFFLGLASPDGRYNLLLQSVMPTARIYVSDNLTQKMWLLFYKQPDGEQRIGWPYGWHPDGRRVFLYDPDYNQLKLVDIETSKFIIPALTSGSV